MIWEHPVRVPPKSDKDRFLGKVRQVPGESEAGSWWLLGMAWAPE